ncbi:class I SAM-dependent methyltransferase, partial [Bacillus thuringiensis]|nr:class I SAM-dependent methyltransferase [Bacillus thuringiensis]
MSELNKEMTLLPPPELVQYVGGDFKKVGKEFLKHFIQIGALKPNEKVLDVGCGVGRMAVPLLNYLNDD